MKLQPVADRPGLWTNHDWQPGTPGTFAVIIGVSAYDHLLDGTGKRADDTYTLGQLYVSALTAQRFFGWLQERYRHPTAPLAQCWLLLAPSPAELAFEQALATNVLRPSFDNCKKAVHEWADTLNDGKFCSPSQSRAIFFFCGHGLEVSNEKQILLPSDFLYGGDNSLNDALSTANLFNGLESSQVPNQLFFVDACRNDHPRLREMEIEGAPILTKHLAAHANPNRNAPIFFASATAGQAWQPRKPEDGPSIFGQALLEGLQAQAGLAPECHNGTCTVTTYRLAEFLEKRVPKLLKDQSATLSQLVRLGGINTNLQITQVDAPQLGGVLGSGAPAAPASSGAPEQPTWAQVELPANWRPQEVDVAEAKRVFGAAAALWQSARCYSLERGVWLAPSRGFVVHRVESVADDSHRVTLSFPASLGGHWLELSDGNQVFACILPDERARARYNIAVIVAPGAPQLLRIERVEAELALDNEGVLGQTAALWQKYRALRVAEAADAIDLRFAEKALRSKRQSPLAAIVGALILLRARRYDRLHDWLQNLTDWFPRLADGPALLAEKLMQVRAAGSSPHEAATALNELQQRGLPATADALGYAAAQADDLWAEEIQTDSVRQQLSAALRYFRSGGLFCVFAGPHAAFGPELVAAPPTIPQRSPMKLPQPTMSALRQVLLRCDEFRSQERLSAFFATSELHIWKNRLPEAGTQRDRVDQTIDYLHDKRRSDSAAALALLLRELAANYEPGDDRRDELEELGGQIGGSVGGATATQPASSAAAKPPALSSRRRTMLEQKLDGLYKVLQLRNERIQFLEDQLTKEAGAPQRFQIEQELKGDRTEAEKLGREISELETQLQ